MNNIHKSSQWQLKGLLPFILAGIFLSFAACSNDDVDMGPPVISKITKTDPVSIGKDSTFTEAFPNQMIVIHGENFDGLRSVYFNGMEAYFNSNYTTNNSIIVTIPEEAPTAATNPEVPDNIRVVTTHGEAAYDFQLLVDAPVISGISNEFAFPGSTINIRGSNFYNIEEVSFLPGAGGNPTIVQGSEISVVGDSIINVRVPENLSEGDSLAVTNEFGTDTFSFHSESGMISNFDDLNLYSWGATAVQDDPMSYPGNRGSYVTMEVANIGGGDWSWWNPGRSINLNPSQLLPADELDNPIEDYVMKFEIYVREPWHHGNLMILPQNSWEYVHLYQPWKVNETTTKAFSTEGWKTVTIPLNQFLTKENGQDGTGDPAPNLSALLGATGNASLNFYFVNNSATLIENFAIAIDNIRIVENQ